MKIHIHFVLIYALAIGDAREAQPDEVGDDFQLERRRRVIFPSLHPSPEWLTELQIEEHQQQLRKSTNNSASFGPGYFDVTHFPEPFSSPITSSAFQYPSQPRYQEQVNKLIQLIDVQFMQRHMTTLTEFHNRYYSSRHGLASAEWLYGVCRDLIVEHGRSNDVTVSRLTHDTFRQFNVIVRFAPMRQSDEDSEPVVILGAHQDSINSQVPSSERPEARAPGAGDDGSGTVVLLSVLRILLQTNFHPVKPLEFQFYAAEEVGLQGSQLVARHYSENRIQVYGMVTFDMCSWHPKPGIGDGRFVVILDYVDLNLTAFVRKLVVEYGQMPTFDFVCTYPCSDNASFYRAGYPAAFVIEWNWPIGYNIHRHTEHDSIDHVNFDFMAQWVRLGIASAVELSSKI